MDPETYAREIADRSDVERETVEIELDAEEFEAAQGRNEDTGGGAVTTAVFDDDGRILLVRNQWSEGWITPGGMVDPGEDPCEAAVREVREETGVECELLGPVAVTEQRLTYEESETTTVTVSFEARATDPGGDPGTDGEDHEEIRAAEWFAEPPADLADPTAALLKRIETND